MSWKDPAERGLEVIIEEEKFYPITILREVDKKMKTTLGDNGIIVLKQIIDADLKKLAAKTGIREERLEGLERNARKLLKG